MKRIQKARAALNLAATIYNFMTTNRDDARNFFTDTVSRDILLTYLLTGKKTFEYTNFMQLAPREVIYRAHEIITQADLKVKEFLVIVNKQKSK